MVQITWRPGMVPALMVLAMLLQPAFAPSVHGQQALETGRSTGLPVPRFVSLDSDKVNVRFGPGKQYPIHWVFTQPGIPLEVVAEFDNWRKIKDYEGAEGWILGGLLSSRRTIMVQGATRELRRTASGKARVLLRAEPGVIGQLFECREAWCRVEVEGRRGWLQRGEFWGTLPGEAVQ